jgi:translation initiation factor IF-3
VAKIAKATRAVRVNERIRVSQVRLVDENGEMLGVKATKEALEIARDRGFDLVEVSPNASPPVCRIMDYGKYKYEQSKKAKRARKKQHTMQVKEIKMRPKIEAHDYGFKMNHARKFLEHNNKVKFSLIFRGREVTHPDIGLNILKRVAEDLTEMATVEVGPKREGMTIMMVVCPKPGIGKTEEDDTDDAADQGTEAGDAKAQDASTPKVDAGSDNAGKVTEEGNATD